MYQIYKNLFSLTRKIVGSYTRDFTLFRLWSYFWSKAISSSKPARFRSTVTADQKDPVLWERNWVKWLFRVACRTGALAGHSRSALHQGEGERRARERFILCLALRGRELHLALCPVNCELFWRAYFVSGLIIVERNFAFQVDFESEKLVVRTRLTHQDNLR